MNIEIDFNAWIGKKLQSYGIQAMETSHTSQSYITLQIEDKHFLISNLCEYEDPFGQEEYISKLTLQEGLEELEEMEVNERIEAVYVIKETQIYKEEEEQTYSHMIAIVLETEHQQYCFEKDDVSFSEIIRITTGKDVLSSFPKKNIWFEEEQYYGMDEIQTSTIQEILSFKEKKLHFEIQGENVSQIESFKKEHNHCSPKNFLTIFGRGQVVVECTCGKRLVLHD